MGPHSLIVCPRTDFLRQSIDRPHLRTRRQFQPRHRQGRIAEGCAVGYACDSPHAQFSAGTGVLAWTLTYEGRELTFLYGRGSDRKSESPERVYCALRLRLCF